MAERAGGDMTRRLGLVLTWVFLAVSGPACQKGQTVTAPSLTAQCAASPGSGTAPLTVAFTLNVAGAQGAFSVAIDYGDGTKGTEPDRPHVYTSAGSYTPSFTVTTSTQSARCSAAVTVAAPAPTPTPGPNQPPQAVFKTKPSASGSTISGKAPLTVEFNLCLTEDPEKDPLRYTMDLNGDGAYEFQGSTGADCRHPATYGVGTHPATICVTDIACTTWPACAGYPTLHPLQCRGYSVVVGP
jgi:hypothetical protein